MTAGFGARGTGNLNSSSQNSGVIPENDWSWVAPLPGYGANSHGLINPSGSSDQALLKSISSDAESFGSTARAVVNGSVDVWGSPGDLQEIYWAQHIPLHAMSGSRALQASLESLLGRGASTGLSPATAATVASARYFSIHDEVS